MTRDQLREVREVQEMWEGLGRKKRIEILRGNSAALAREAQKQRAVDHALNPLPYNPYYNPPDW